MNAPAIHRVYLFGTCLIDVFHPRAGMAAVRLLEREGVEVVFPEEQTCCGQPPYNSGYDDEARAVARQVVRRFNEPIPVIVPSGSCAGMLRHHYPSLLADGPLAEAARDLAARTYELHEFLNRVLQVKWQDHGDPVKIVMHTSCSARREMGVREDGLALLKQLKGVDVCEPENAEACCGFGGTFAVKMSDISAAMATDKCSAIRATEAGQLLSSDCGCLLNIDGMLRKQGANLPAEHLAEFLWKRTGGDTP